MTKTQDKSIKIMSFGYKYGIPAEINFLQDVRFLPNPFYEDELREKTGKCKEVQAYIKNSPVTLKFLEDLRNFLTNYVTEYFNSGKENITVAIGCTGGRHRSVAVAEYVYDFLKDLGYNIDITHMDIQKG